VTALFTRPFILAALANLLLTLAAFMFVHLPGFLRELGAGEAEIGRIMAVQSLGAVVAWPLVGRVTDRHGRRIVILTGVGLFAIAIGLYLAIDEIGPAVYGVRFVDGAAFTMWYTALFTYAADLVPASRRTEGLAIFGVSGLIPIGLGAYVGDRILASAAYHDLFVGALGFSLGGLLVCLPLQDVAVTRPGTTGAPRGVLATAAQRNLLAIWLAAIAFFIAALALVSFMKTFVIAARVGSVGGFFGVYSATAVLLRLFLGQLPDRLGARAMLGMAMASFASGLMVLSVAQTPAHVLVAGLLCGAGHGYTFPVLFSLVVTRSRPQERGAATAFFTTLNWLGFLVAGPLLGWLIERSGYRTFFVLLALLLALGLSLFYALDRRSV
jgi:MFS family permease